MLDYTNVFYLILTFKGIFNRRGIFVPKEL